MSDENPRPSLEEAAPLVHAIVSTAAEAAGIRALAIKGPALVAQGLREQRLSADVDVLVHPRDHAAIVAALGRLGWHPAVTTTNARVLPRHSADLVSENWPVSLDVHHYFPGFLEDAGQAFDCLWSRHDTVELAGVDVPVCDRIAHAALYALHMLRDQPGDLLSAEFHALVSRAITFRDAEREDLASLAATTGATGTLRPFLAALGIAPPAQSNPDQAAALAQWQLRRRSGSFDGWLAELRRTSPLRWPSLVWHALVLTEEELLAYHGSGRDVSTNRLRWERVVRGAELAGRRLLGRVRRHPGTAGGGGHGT